MKQTAASWSLRLSRFEFPAIRVQIVMLLLAVLVLLPYNPTAVRFPEMESGVYLFTGSEMLNGSVLYRDLWDNKPPLIHSINAIGLALGGPGRWGVWCIEVVSLGGAAVLLFSLLLRYFGGIPAAAALLGFFANLGFVLERGNLPEEYHLLFQTAVIVLLAAVLSRPRAPVYALLMGICVGLSISLNLNLIGAGVLAALFLLLSALYNRSWLRLLDFAALIGGVLLVWAGWAAYFSAQKALPAFWDAAFLFNLYVNRVGAFDRVAYLRESLLLLYRTSGFFALGMLAWLAAAPFLFLNEKRIRVALTGRWTGWVIFSIGAFILFNGVWDDRSERLFAISALSTYRVALIVIGVFFLVMALFILSGGARRAGQSLVRSNPFIPVNGLLFPLSFALLNLPLEFALASFSGRNSLHSFVPLLPSLTILIAFLVWSLMSARPEASNRAVSYLWLAALGLLVLGSGIAFTIHLSPRLSARRVTETAAQVRALTRPDQPILQWGSNTDLYGVADRSPASRYLYLHPLFTAGYATPERVLGFLDELRANPPQVLIDTRQENMFLMLPEPQNCSILDTEAGLETMLRAERDSRFPAQRELELPYYPPEMRIVYRWLCERYERIPGPESDLDAWRIYRLRAGQD